MSNNIYQYEEVNFYERFKFFINENKLMFKLDSKPVSLQILEKINIELRKVTDGKTIIDNFFDNIYEDVEKNVYFNEYQFQTTCIKFKSSSIYSNIFKNNLIASDAFLALLLVLLDYKLIKFEDKVCENKINFERTKIPTVDILNIIFSQISLEGEFQSPLFVDYENNLKYTFNLSLSESISILNYFKMLAYNLKLNIYNIPVSHSQTEEYKSILNCDIEEEFLDTHFKNIEDIKKIFYDQKFFESIYLGLKETIEKNEKEELEEMDLKNTKMGDILKDVKEYTKNIINDDIPKSSILYNTIRTKNENNLKTDFVKYFKNVGKSDCSLDCDKINHIDIKFPHDEENLIVLRITTIGLIPRFIKLYNIGYDNEISKLRNKYKIEDIFKINLENGLFEILKDVITNNYSGSTVINTYIYENIEYYVENAIRHLLNDYNSLIYIDYTNVYINSIHIDEHNKNIKSIFNLDSCINKEYERMVGIPFYTSVGNSYPVSIVNLISLAVKTALEVRDYYIHKFN